MLRALATWWASRMLELVPARLSRDATTVGPAAVIDPGEIGDLLPSRDRSCFCPPPQRPGNAAGRLRPWAASVPSREVALRVPGRLLLEQRVTLPLAAERDPGRVLHYEMDRLTPFAADDVFWSFSVLRLDRANKQLVLLLSLVPKAPLAALLAALGRAGLRPTVLEATRPDGMVRQISLGAGRSRQTMVLTRAGAALGVACAALAVATIALPFVLQSLELDAVEARIATLRPLAAEAAAARLRHATEVGTAGAAATERTRVGDALQALAAVTDLLPDDTYLTDLTLRARRLTIGGRSNAAVKLIPALAADRTIGDPAFLAPVTRAASGRPDIFSIAAELRNDWLAKARGFALPVTGDLPTGRRGQALAAALTLTLLAALWAGAVSPLLEWYQQRADLLERQQALLAGMQALVDAVRPLQRQGAVAAPGGLSGDTDALADATLLGAVQKMAGDAGASLSSSGALPPEQVAGSRRIGVRVTLRAPWAVLVHLMQSVEQATPRLLVDDLQLHARRVGGSDRRHIFGVRAPRRAAGDRAVTPGRRVAALGLLAAGLGSVILLELERGGTVVHAGAARVAATPRAVVVAGDESGAQGQWVATLLARPPFSPDRRPTASAVADPRSVAGVPRLAGILISPNRKLAIFATDGAAKPLTALEGDAVGRYRVLSIEVGEVILHSSDGTHVLHLNLGAPVAQQTGLAASGNLVARRQSDQD